MFKKAQHIDKAFKHIKAFSIGLVAACVLISCFALYKSIELVNNMQQKVYVLANGQAIKAYSAPRDEHIEVEIRDHVKNFHHYFFTLDPDEAVIEEHIGKALYLSDASAKKQYDDLKEGNYYSGIISGNISQRILVDSIHVSVADHPFYFRCYATQQLTRPTSILTRSLVTEGYLRNVSRSDHNPHGFLIERWKILENKDLNVKNR